MHEPHVAGWAFAPQGSCRHLAWDGCAVGDCAGDTVDPPGALVVGITGVARLLQPLFKIASPAAVKLRPLK